MPMLKMVLSIKLSTFGMSKRMQVQTNMKK